MCPEHSTAALYGLKGDGRAARTCGDFAAAEDSLSRQTRMRARRQMRVFVGIGAVFVLGLLVSGALGDVSPITIGTTFSSSTSSDTTSTAASDSSSTSTGTSASSTT